MANQYPAIDPNTTRSALLGNSGTANSGLETRRIVAVNGAMWVNEKGTVPVNLNNIGTIIVSDGTTNAGVVTHTDDDTNLDGLTAQNVAAGLYARVDGSIMKPLRMDASTHSMQVIDYAHHETHAGSHFDYCEQVALGNGSARDLLIVTPDTLTWSHLLFRIRSSGESNYNLYEGAVTSNDGTQVVTFNRNRNSAGTANTLIYHTPTVGTTGTSICMQHFGAGQRSGGDERGDNEWVLKQNTKYLLRITSEAAANDVSTNINWYEHADKD